jgi:hypothetical protein
MSFEEILKKLIWDAAVQAALKALFAAVPWLGWGPLGVFVGFVVGIFADKFFEFAKTGFIAEVLIPVDNAILKRELDTRAVKLKMLAVEKGIDSKEFQESRRLHAKALAEFGFTPR